MKKIPSLFVRDYEKELVDSKNITISIDDHGNIEEGTSGNIYKKGRFLSTREITPGCEWVINGEGVPTRKWDGMAVKIEGGSIYKRYDAKHGKTAPEGFEPCQYADPITGHWPGWIRIDHMSDAGADKWIWESLFNTFQGAHTNGKDGTYEAIGPKINGNKDDWENHFLIRHGEGGWGRIFYPP